MIEEIDQGAARDLLPEAKLCASAAGEDGHDTPALPAPVQSAWGEAELRASELVRQASGTDLVGTLLAELRARPGAQVLSIGAAAGALALELVQHGLEYEVTCIDNTVDALHGAGERARALGVNVRLVETDLDAVKLEPAAFDLVFCHAALYRVSEVEGLLGEVKHALRKRGAFVVVDVVAPAGFAMWPATRDVAQAIWKTLPAKFRLNHTAHGCPLIDDEIWQPPPIPAGTKVPRPETIIPSIGNRFVTEHFVPYFSLSRRFFDSMYGPNYDLSAPLDRAIFDWIWELDVHYIAAKRLRPETFFGVYRAA